MKRAKVGETAERVHAEAMALAAAGEPVSTAEIGRRLGLHPPAILYHKKRLAQAGRWPWPPAPSGPPKGSKRPRGRAATPEPRVKMATHRAIAAAARAMGLGIPPLRERIGRDTRRRQQRPSPYPKPKAADLSAFRAATALLLQPANGYQPVTQADPKLIARYIAEWKRMTRRVQPQVQEAIR